MRQPEFEAMDREELELLQLERLQSTLTRAYRQVKFYRQQFDRLGLRPEAVPRQGIAGIRADRVQEARALGRRVKQVARGWREGKEVRVSVTVEELPLEHPLAPIEGTSNALLARTDLLKELLVSERNPGLRQTAFAVYSDLIAIHEGHLVP